MRIAMAINTMKGHKIWLYSSELFGSDVNMFDGVAVLRCVELKWLVAGEAFQATSALVVPIRIRANDKVLLRWLVLKGIRRRYICKG